MAKKRPKASRRPGQPQEPDDAFIARVLELSVWARARAQLLIIAGAGLVLVVAGIVYYANLQRTHARDAERELERIQQIVAFAPPEEGKEELRTYLNRYGDTRFGHEARLTLGELHLHEGEPSDAIDVLQPTRGALRDPVGVQGAFLLGVALEEQGRLQEAEELYLELAEQAQLSFQRREALEGAARVRMERDDYAGASVLYERLLNELEPDDPRRNRYELRLAEMEARIEG